MVERTPFRHQTGEALGQQSDRANGAIPPRDGIGVGAKFKQDGDAVCGGRAYSHFQRERAGTLCGVHVGAVRDQPADAVGRVSLRRIEQRRVA